jgi:hypothetical protein
LVDLVFFSYTEDSGMFHLRLPKLYLDTIRKLSTRHRLYHQLKATKEEAEKLNEKWTDFTSGVNDDFAYFTETNSTPQYIKVSRNGDKLTFNVSTTVTIEEDDIKKLTDMFSQATSAVHKYYAVPSKAGLSVKEKSSSLNLLA